MSEKLRFALRSLFLKVLGPLVRQAIKHNISHGEFCEIAKEAYVEQSYQHFTLPERKMTVSRVAVLTGLSRKEVVRLSSRDPQVSQPKIIFNSATRVTMGWLSDSKFCDKKGQPQILPLKDGENSFAMLVEQFSGDVPVAAVLAELIRLGVASKEGANSVRLNKRGYIPDASEVDKLEILATCAKDLLNTGVHNIETENSEDVRFQRQLVHRVPMPLAKEFKIFSEQKAQDLLLEFNQWLREKQLNDKQPYNDQLTEIGFGIYFVEDQHHENSE